MPYNEVDSTNLESAKKNRKKVSSPKWGGADSALRKGPRGKRRSKKRTVVK